MVLEKINGMIEEVAGHILGQSSVARKHYSDSGFFTINSSKCVQFLNYLCKCLHKRPTLLRVRFENLSKLNNNDQQQFLTKVQALSSTKKMDVEPVFPGFIPIFIPSGKVLHSSIIGSSLAFFGSTSTSSAVPKCESVKILAPQSYQNPHRRAMPDQFRFAFEQLAN